jgi:hypothetical protein
VGVPVGRAGADEVADGTATGGGFGVGVGAGVGLGVAVAVGMAVGLAVGVRVEVDVADEDGDCAAGTTSGMVVTEGGVVTETSPRTPLADSEVAVHW